MINEGDIVNIFWEHLDAEYEVEVISRPGAVGYCWTFKRRDGIIIVIRNFGKMVKARKKEIEIIEIGNKDILKRG